jgi:AAA domain/DnaB-like helicase N terminal domain
MTDQPPFGAATTATVTPLPAADKPDSGIRNRPRSDLPPHDPDAEQAILGTILRTAQLDQASAVALVELAPDPACFYRPHHETLAVQLRAAAAAGEPLEPVAVLARLQNAGEMRGPLTGAYLHDLVERAILPGSMSWYAERVRELWADRCALQAVDRARQRLAGVHDRGERHSALYEAMGELENALDPNPNGHRELTTGSAFLAAPDAEYDWLIPGLIERGDRVIWTAGEGHGKTTLLRQFGVQGASGIHPFGGSDYEPLTVLMVDVENGERQTRRKLRPLILAAGINYSDRLYIELRPGGLDLAGQTDDAAWLHELAAAARPDLLIIGPLYKLHRGNPIDEEPAKAIADVIDRIRVEHGCAVMMEAHTPHAENRKGATRPIRPYGASLWMRWPEFGLHLSEQGAISHWKDRDERDWPGLIERGGTWPWTPAARPRDDLWARIQTLCTEAGDQLSYRDLAGVIGCSHMSVARAIDEHRADWDALKGAGPA